MKLLFLSSVCFALVFFIPFLKGKSLDSNQSFLDDWRQKNHVTSVVVTVENTQIGAIEKSASGTTTLKGGKPVTTENLFGIGSITKTFVAAAMLQLQEEGKLNLDNPIGSYFPQYPRWNSITIRQLLNMTSGIANYTKLAAFEKIQKNPPRKAISPEYFIDMAYDRSDQFAPGKGWYYSNTDYLLAGLIIEKVTGHSLESFFKEHFFNPLHLNHTFYSDGFYSYGVTKEMARAYDGRHEITPFNFSVYGAAGAMLMNAPDLRTWTAALFTPGVILKKSSIDEMTQTIRIPSSPPKPLGARYGLGVYSLDVPEVGTIWYYAGIVDGYTSCFVWVPSQHKIIVAQLAGWTGDEIYLLFPNRELMKELLSAVSLYDPFRRV